MPELVDDSNLKDILIEVFSRSIGEVIYKGTL